jgi:hypothetical protein
VQRHDGWGGVPFWRRGLQQLLLVLGEAERNVCGGAVREADTLYGTEPRVVAEPLCGLGRVI